MINYLTLDRPACRLLGTVMVTFFRQGEQVSGFFKACNWAQSLSIRVHLQLVRFEAIGEEAAQEACRNRRTTSC